MQQFALQTQQRDAEIARHTQETERRNADQNSFANRLAKASKITKVLLYQMPNDANLVCHYLNEVDNIMDANQIADDLRITLLTQYLNPRVRALMRDLPEDERTDYAKFKARLLREFNLNPSTHRNNFDNAKRGNESSGQFVTRLNVLLNTYLQSKSVGTLDELKNLLVLERFKSCLIPQHGSWWSIKRMLISSCLRTKLLNL